MKKGTKVLCVVGCVALTTAGIIIIPKIIQKQGNRIYKSLLAKDEIDIDSMGPVIVPFEDALISTKDGTPNTGANEETDLASDEED